MISLLEAQELIAKKLSGEITASEDSQLNNWIAATSENEAVWMQSKKIWDNAAQQQLEVNVDLAWQKVNAQTKQTAKVFKLSYTAIGAIAASFLLVTSVVFWFSNGASVAKVSTASNQIKMFELPDGSKIWLHEFSELSYDSDNPRNVNLNGLAFFDVKRDEAHPFTISTPNGQVKVLGTSFEVEAYATAKQERVTVKTGKVQFASNQGAKVVLTPNLEATITADGALTMDTLSVDEEAWFNADKLVFQDQKMDKALQKIERFFHVKVKLANANINNCHFTGSFAKPQLKQVFEAICQSLQLSYEQKGNTIILSGNGCQINTSK